MEGSPSKPEAKRPDDDRAPAAEQKPTAAPRTRRDVVRAGLVAAPLILTLRSRPANAASASLGSLGIFYGNYTNQDADGNPITDSSGKEIWVPADADGKPVTDDKGEYDYDRRDQKPSN